MDKHIANNVSLGIFVFIGFLGFTFLLFKIGNGSNVLSSQYTLYAKYKHVKGLHPGSEVSLSGLRIGVIKDIEVAGDVDKELVVRMSIDKKYQVQVRGDSVAAIVTQGVLGDKYVELTIGSQEFQPLEDGATINSAAEGDIWSRGKELLEKVGGKFEEGGDVNELLKNLNKLTSNLAVLTTDVKKGKGVLNALVYGQGGPKMDSAVAHVDGIMAKINSGKGTLGALVNDPTLYEDMKYLLGGARRSTVLKYFMKQFIDDGVKKPEE